MRKKITYLIFVILIINPVLVFSESEKSLGEFTAGRMTEIKSGCAKGPILGVSIRPLEVASDCRGKILIQSIGVRYESGFEQYLDFDSGGSPLTSTQVGPLLRVLPDTRCVKNIMVKSSVSGEFSARCQNLHRFRVSYRM